MTDRLSAPIFPGATALTRLSVYDWDINGEPPGGTPHLHTASTEAYLVVSGSGQVETLSTAGFAVHELAVGDLLWFSPGTIHRLINTKDLDLLVVMQNAGLPEAGDAIMTFSPKVLAEPSLYSQAASLQGADPEQLQESVMVRRAAALAGFEYLKQSVLKGDFEPLAQFQRQAVDLVKDRVPQWRETWEQTVAAQTRATDRWLSGLERGEYPHFQQAATAVSRPAGTKRTFGMCGLLQTWTAPDSAVPVVRAGN